MPSSMFFEFWILIQLFSLSSFNLERLKFLFTLSIKGDVIGMPEVINISPNNLDSSLQLMQTSILHDVLCI